MNRVGRFAQKSGNKFNNVGVALQILQRRLASSPAAIYRSLKRRRERLEVEHCLAIQGAPAVLSSVLFSEEDLINIDEYGQREIDDLEGKISTGATAAETLEQLDMEVQTLKGLEQQALPCCTPGKTPSGNNSTRSLMMT